MSSDEEKQILKMVENGKISAEEAMTLIKALEETSNEDEVEVIETEADTRAGRSASLDFEEVKARVQKFAMFPLWIGVAFTVLGAYWMYALVSNANYGFLVLLRLAPAVVGFAYCSPFRQVG